MRVEEKIVKAGYFWLPAKDDEKRPGTLTISDGGEIELEIVGLFDERVVSINDDLTIGRIIGHIEIDGYVTLDNCYYTNKNMSFGAISKSKIYSNKLLVGAAYEKDEPVAFNTFSFSTDCFDEWLRITGISVTNNWEAKEHSVSYSPPDKLFFHLENGMRLEIGFAYSLPVSNSMTEVRITQSGFIKLNSTDLRPLSEFIEIAFKLTNLLCFAIDEIVSIKNVTATSCEFVQELSNGDSRPSVVKIYYPSIPFSGHVPNKNWHQMLFTFGEIKVSAHDVFNKWLSAYEKIEPAINLYFSTKGGAHKYIDGKFLALAQGLETYHRRTSDEKLMKPELFDDLVKVILKNTPVDNLEWLEGRLTHGNEISLGKRLKRIVEPFKEKLGNSSDRSKLIRKIVDTRNYFTHYNENLKGSVGDGSELFFLSRKMEIIFQLHFLKVIGFSDEEIDCVIENCHPLKNKLNETL